MADVVVAVTIFHQHSQACLPCSGDSEGDHGIVCKLDAPSFIFPLFVHFLLSSLRLL
jgi:hypothetical protein